MITGNYGKSEVCESVTMKVSQEVYQVHMCFNRYPYSDTILTIHRTKTFIDFEETISLTILETYEEYIYQYNWCVMNREVSQYYIRYLLKTYMEQVKRRDINTQRNTLTFDNFINDYTLPLDIKRSQLYSQLMYEAITHFTIDVWKKMGK